MVQFLIYDCEIRAISEEVINKQRVTAKSMERSMIGTTGREKKSKRVYKRENHIKGYSKNGAGKEVEMDLTLGKKERWPVVQGKIKLVADC